jgi:hypothetical protein
MSSYLSDEQIYTGLESVIDYFCDAIPVGKSTSFYPDYLGKVVVKKLEQEYNPKMAHAFLRAAYWYLINAKILEVTPAINYTFKEKIDEQQKIDLCMKIFAEYETFLQANYARSLIEPGFPKLLPSTEPINTKVFSAGK